MHKIDHYQISREPLPPYDQLPKISVQVAIYNSSDYLDRCVESLIRQTYPKLEIILTDDGSTDDSPAKCDAYAEKYPQIKVIHKPNGGLADCRNAGIEAATGDYITFLDGDDWVDDYIYETYYRLLTAFHADAVFCNYKCIYRDHVKDTSSDMIAVFENLEALEAIITEDKQFNIQNATWNKFCSRDFLGDLRLDKTRPCYEDILFSAKVYSRPCTVVYTNLAMINYCVDREGSMINLKSIKSILHDQIPYYNDREQLLHDIGRDDLADIHGFFFFKRMMLHYRDFYHSTDPDRKKYMKQLLQVIRCDRDRIRRAMASPAADRGHRARMKLLLFNPTLFVHISDFYDNKIIPIKLKRHKQHGE